MSDIAVVPPKGRWFDIHHAPEGFNADAEDLWRVVQKVEGLHDMISDIRADHKKKLQMLGRKIFLEQ
ncbi:hypothetical protein M885DRAFT_577252 [Pelagophyceae sp. CCMP2097]|nr:hypothetical protein M885DRAFT_577252 [Pelagophyceae sp. CCMP2097]